MLLPERISQKQEPQLQGYMLLLLRPQEEVPGHWKGPLRSWVGEKYS